MSYITFLIILIAIILLQSINRTHNHTYFTDLNIFVFFVLIISIFVKYSNNNIIGSTLFIFLSLILIISFINYKIILNDNFLIIQKGVFSKKTNIDISNIKKIYISNEFVTDTSQFFLNFVLKNSNVEKTLLLFVSPLDLLKQIKEKNPNVDIEFVAIEKFINKNKKLTFIFYTLFLMTSLYILLFYTK